MAGADANTQAALQRQHVILAILITSSPPETGSRREKQKSPREGPLNNKDAQVRQDRFFSHRPPARIIHHPVANGRNSSHGCVSRAEVG
jgi:hypothetical protein